MQRYVKLFKLYNCLKPKYIPFQGQSFFVAVPSASLTIPLLLDMNPVDEENVGSRFIQVMLITSLHRNVINTCEKSATYGKYTKKADNNHF